MAFVPLPLLAFAHTRSIKKAVVWALAIAILIEPLQLVIDLATGFPSFVVDVDDMMLQVLGSAAGIVLIWRSWFTFPRAARATGWRQIGVSEGARQRTCLGVCLLCFPLSLSTSV